MSHSSNLKVLRRENNFLIINPSTGKWDVCLFPKIKEVVYKLKKSSTISSCERKGLICVIHLTNRCNLECKYCYADVGEKRENVLSNDKIKKIFDILDSSSYEFILVEFHGGEPLLCWEKIKDVVPRYYKKRIFTFGIQTNGTLLTQKIIDFIKIYSIRIGISIDGPQRIHDRNRCYHNDNGSFQDVMRGIFLLQQNKVPFTTISVVEKPNECIEIFNFFVNNRIEKIKLNPLFFKGRMVKKNIISHNIDC
ncbi:MAG: radical SAM protein [bacterium]